MIQHIQTQWHRFVSVLPDDPANAFERLHEHIGGANRFVTIAFLLHLLYPEQIPSIDQHNFRAVNSLMQAARQGWRIKKLPSRHSDIVLVSEFMKAIRKAWTESETHPVPNESEGRLFGRGGLGLWEAARGCMLKIMDFLVAYSRDRGSGYA